MRDLSLVIFPTFSINCIRADYRLLLECVSGPGIPASLIILKSAIITVYELVFGQVDLFTPLDCYLYYNGIPHLSYPLDMGLHFYQEVVSRC